MRDSSHARTSGDGGRLVHWWAALVAAATQARASAGSVEVAAISVAGQQHGLVALDRDRRVLRPAKLWNDTESAPNATALTAGREAEWAEAVGSVPVASFTITKLCWLAEHEPANFERIATVLLPHDWLTFRLSRRLVTDRGDASGTGYWSPADDRWRPELLARELPARSGEAWAACLPTVARPTETVGPLRAAEELGLPRTAIVAPGTGDNMAAALGVGLRPGDVAVSIGTSGTVFATSDRSPADASGAVAGFADATGRFLPLVCILNATLVTEAFARLLAVDVGQLDDLALVAPADAGGVVLVPYLAGERTPNRPGATGSVSGLRTDVSREALARAAFNGVACGLLDGLDALARAGVATTGGRMILVGGGRRSAAYRRVVADLSGRPLTIPAPDELVALGACIQAAATLSGDDPFAVIDRWGVRRGTSVEPDLAVDRASIRSAYAAAAAPRPAGNDGK
ncbi:MAG: xylulokinase [Actinobacteria bacterium]|nr:xylulokinase [Actinomycetota bacterium]